MATYHAIVLNKRHDIDIALVGLDLADQVLERFFVLALLDVVNGSMTDPFVSAAMSGVEASTGALQRSCDRNMNIPSRLQSAFGELRL